MYKKILPFFIGLTFIAACTGGKKVALNEPMEERQLETLTVTAPKEDKDFSLPVYQATATREQDLLHTSLDVRFDWEKQHLLGKATLKLKPYFYPSNTLVLDAKGFDFHKVSIKTKTSSKDTEYDYDGKQITISLDRMYKRGEEYTVYIEYTAKPNDLEVGGSAAITADKGLYFINPLGEDKNKPRQIWTQGETESSSCWFPTIDKPNERCTQDIKITVEDNFQTLSNGKLKSANKNSDGTRTDHYVMDLPHAPYLFMMAVGEFAVVKDRWENIELEYIVEKDYKPYAKQIYNHTPEMLTFFSEKLGVKYPWPKFSQIIVRDYVSGAMENTTAVIFGEFVQKTDKELIDSDNDGIVAHELIHHWFGDLLTCESWSNLPLNESFANYGEYLWFEHKYGKDRAESHRKNEINGYMSQAKRGGMHDLIDFNYDDKEDMFDGHSYNKGGAILHMLRKYLGDDAFFASLNYYITENQYTDVEAQELRLAFEEVTGKDLNWFFNQWFFDQGHPSLEYTYNYVGRNLELTVEQVQDPETHVPVYQLPITVDVFTSKGKKRTDIWLDKRKQTFKISSAEKPALVIMDAEHALLGEFKDKSKTQAEYVYQYYNGNGFLDRITALEKLKGKDTEASNKLFVDALKDPYWVVRREALNNLKPGNEDKIRDLALNDKHSRVRTSAVKKLGKSEDRKYLADLKKAVANDPTDRVVANGIVAISKLDEQEGISYADKFKKTKSPEIIGAVAEIYANTGDSKYLSFFEDAIPGMEGFGIFGFMTQYTELLKKADGATQAKSFGKLKDLAINQSTWQWKRFTATKAMNDVRTALKGQLEEADDTAKPALQTRVDGLTEIIEKIKAAETNDRLKGIYSSY